MYPHQSLIPTLEDKEANMVYNKQQLVEVATDLYRNSHQDNNISDDDKIMLKKTMTKQYHLSSRKKYFLSYPN